MFPLIYFLCDRSKALHIPSFRRDMKGSCNNEPYFLCSKEKNKRNDGKKGLLSGVVCESSVANISSFHAVFAIFMRSILR